jgi:hypothetical protein
LISDMSRRLEVEDELADNSTSREEELPHLARRSIGPGRAASIRSGGKTKVTSGEPKP